MIREEYAKIDRRTSRGRYEYLQMLKDSRNAEVIEEIEGMVISPEPRLRYGLMAE